MKKNVTIILLCTIYGISWADTHSKSKKPTACLMCHTPHQPVIMHSKTGFSNDATPAKLNNTRSTDIDIQVMQYINQN